MRLTYLGNNGVKPIIIIRTIKTKDTIYLSFIPLFLQYKKRHQPTTPITSSSSTSTTGIATAAATLTVGLGVTMGVSVKVANGVVTMAELLAANKNKLYYGLAVAM